MRPFRSCYSWAGWGVAGVVLWLALLDPPVVQEPGLDPSWQLSLGHFLLHRSRAGVDYFWTYGPLGYLATPAYHPALFPAKVLWEVVVKFAVVALLLRLAVRLPILFRMVG